MSGNVNKRKMYTWPLCMQFCDQFHCQWLRYLWPAFVARAMLPPYRAIVNLCEYFRAVESPQPCGRAGRYDTRLLSSQDLNVRTSGLQPVRSITLERRKWIIWKVLKRLPMGKYIPFPHSALINIGGWTRPRHDLDWRIGKIGNNNIFRECRRQLVSSFNGNEWL